MWKNIINSIICGIILITFASGCFFHSKIKYISNNLKINIENCKIESEIDSHGGFLGDGDYFAKIICTKNEEEKIKSNWKKLPLSTELQEVMDMKQCDSNECKNVYEKYNIPNIKNGYYYFYDRNSKNNDLNTRNSYNFSIGIYDSDNKILYYYELDT